jgi:DNA adenine methylase
LSASDTSLAAASAVAGTAEQMRGRALVEIRSRGVAGATCDEVEVALEMKHQTASARLRELALEGEIADSGERRRTRSGCKAAVWVVSPLAGLTSPLKWAGSKRWALPLLRRLYEPHRGRRLVEPFVGGMNVALGLRPDRTLLADVNEHLINFYLRLRNPSPFTIEMENDEARYYVARDRFNDSSTSATERAELFYYLNRTCFNGLCRFNASGGFNVPYGKYKKINYRRDFSEYAELLRKWDVRCCGFHALDVDPDDFVLLDPPYDGTFSDYSAGGFDWDEQERLAIQFSEHPGLVVAHNQATPRVLELYAALGYRVYTIDAPRSVSANGDREPAREMIATRNIVVDDHESHGLNVLIANSDLISVSNTNSDSEGAHEMASLPKGWGSKVANADATIQRQMLRHGEYILEHRVVIDKATQKGPAIIIEHEIVSSKPTVEGVEPMPPGTKWGYFMADYGEAKVMLLPNMKAYVLGLLGIDEKKKLDELRQQGLTPEQAKAQFAQTLGETIDAIVDDRNMARGMLIRGITFGTKTDAGGDYTGMNWFPVAGENNPAAPSVIARRAASASSVADSVASAAATSAKTDGSGAHTAPIQTPSLPPPPAANLPPPPAADPLATYIAQGWKDYPGRPDCMYNGQQVKLKTDLLAGR